MTHRLFALALTLFACLQLTAAQTDYAGHIASLINPAKHKTAGELLNSVTKPFAP